MDASLAATGMLEVLATRAVLFMILSSTPPISTFNCWMGTIRISVKIKQWSDISSEQTENLIASSDNVWWFTFVDQYSGTIELHYHRVRIKQLTLTKGNRKRKEGNKGLLLSKRLYKGLTRGHAWVAEHAA